MKLIHGNIGIGKICGSFGYTRQSYYKHRAKEKVLVERNQMIIDRVKVYRTRQPKVGTRKVHKMLAEEGISIGRDRLFYLLRCSDMLIKKKRRTTCTTNSYHRFYKYGNIIREKVVDGPNQVFVSDITYIDTLEEPCYLSLVTDKYSRKIVGYHLSDNLSVSGSITALRMAMRTVKEPQRLIHHSDRGIQYCSNQYTGYLKRKKVKISMTEKDHVYENALAERVNGILKDEFLLGERLQSKKIARKMVSQAVEIYNNERLHMALGYVTPQQKYAA